MRILWVLSSLIIVPVLMWQQGTYEKYPELAIPLFLIWLAAMAPASEIPEWTGNGNALNVIGTSPLESMITTYL